MTRFYFHFACDGDEFEDAEGVDLPDLAAARKQALDAVRDVKRARFARYGPDWSGWSLRVSDEAGTHVLTVPFSEPEGA